MELTALTAVSPIDGRYRKSIETLSVFFSESALIKYRVLVEVEYFISLCELPLPELAHFDKQHYGALRALYTSFSNDDAQAIKNIEKITNHDVKAVEYFLKEKFDALGLSKQKEFIHFGLTSQDINNTAIPLSLKEGLSKVYFPLLQDLLTLLSTYSKAWTDIPMLAKTHGQPASPTKLGKEIMVFIERIEKQLLLVNNVPYSGKFGGATGNFNAHHIAYPEINWIDFSNTFLNETLGLSRSQYTTQIEHYDNMAALFDGIKRINTILIDLNRDMWSYISMNYFKQKIKEGETGSSAMPHKVNPIDFENSEGNLGIANALFEHFSAKLPVSRLQRDLTDSTVLRNIGVPVGHTVIAIKSLIKGLEKLLINLPAIEADLEDNWAVVAEALQTVLRKEGYPSPYEVLKEFTRTNSVIKAENIGQFINSLDVSETVKEKLRGITPFNYTGIY
jgi:adenylosuccinate lyase